MPRSTAPFFIALALTFSGCAYHHQVGYPPSAGELAEINRAAAGRPISVHYVEPLAVCMGGACTVSGATSPPGGPPPEIERIVSADNHQLAVVTPSGERWTLPADGVLGVTTRGHATWQGALVGGVIGAAVGSIVAYAAYAGPIGADDNAAAMYDHRSVSGSTAVTILVGVAAVGAIIGAIVGYNTASFDTFELGHTGRAFGPTTLSR